MSVPYKYRGLLLLASLTIILPLAAWRYALRDTLEAWQDCYRTIKQLAQATPTAETPLPIRSDMPELILSGALLDVVRHSAEKNGVRVTGYEPLITQEQDGIAVHTVQLLLTGRYTALLQVVSEIEQKHPECRLCSLTWRTRTDPTTRRTQLTATLYLQQIILKR